MLPLMSSSLLSPLAALSFVHVPTKLPCNSDGVEIQSIDDLGFLFLHSRPAASQSLQRRSKTLETPSRRPPLSLRSSSCHWTYFLALRTEVITNLCVLGTRVVYTFSLWCSIVSKKPCLETDGESGESLTKTWALWWPSGDSQ